MCVHIAVMCVRVLGARAQAMRQASRQPEGLLAVGAPQTVQLPTGDVLGLGHPAYCSPRAALAVQRWQMTRGGAGGCERGYVA